LRELNSIAMKRTPPRVKPPEAVVGRFKKTEPTIKAIAIEVK
jgi:hypothetical protein